MQTELARFPTDVEGQMLLAEIEAQDLNDLLAAGRGRDRVGVARDRVRADGQPVREALPHGVP
ncbi:MAG TPA: hypothetical protein PKZ00_08360, partial [Elusimicrobiota bacterium]|nr:hypothetical protein [Elusimicrobiota bacterium]